MMPDVDSCTTCIGTDSRYPDSPVTRAVEKELGSTLWGLHDNKDDVSDAVEVDSKELIRCVFLAYFVL
jgi:hypothetical protein